MFTLMATLMTRPHGGRFETGRRLPYRVVVRAVLSRLGMVSFVDAR